MPVFGLDCLVPSAAGVPWARPHSTVDVLSQTEKGVVKPRMWVSRIGAVFQGSEASATAGPQSATAAAVGAAAAAAAVATAGAGQPAGAQGLLLLVPLMLGPNGKVLMGRFARSHGLASAHTYLTLSMAT